MTTMTPTQRQLTADFCRTARSMGDRPITRRQNPDIGVWLKDGRDIAALAIFKDELDNWTLLTEDGCVLQFLHNEVL